MSTLITSSEGFSKGRVLLPPAEIDLASTLGCGQAFRWRPLDEDTRSSLPTEIQRELPGHDGAWIGVLSERVTALWRDSEGLSCLMAPGPFDAPLLERYLDTGLCLQDVRQEVRIDEQISAALDSYPGLRILQQDPWECLVSFILSQWSNVPRISGTMEALSRRCGSTIFPGWFAFPTPSRLASLSEADLRSMGLGYRAPYIRSAALKCADQGIEWLHELRHMDYRAARDQVVLPIRPGRSSEKVQGVGPKVADCVLLFSLGHYNAFPIDLHVRRAMERWYGGDTHFTTAYDSIASFGRQRFGRYAGYAQQYLFHRQRVDKG